jgi:hypothetical protein
MDIQGLAPFTGEIVFLAIYWFCSVGDHCSRNWADNSWFQEVFSSGAMWQS